MTRDVQRQLIIVAGLLLVTFCVHAQAVGYGFCNLDDLHQIVQNPTLQWKSAGDFFVKDVWRNPQAQYRNYYRPVFLLWLLVNLKLFGLHPALWHLATLGLHGVVVVLVYRLGLRLLGNEWVAAAAGLLFAVQPVHVESAVWLSGATEPLAGVFFLGAFLQYLRVREKPGTRGMFLCGLFTLLALLAKESSAALPAMIVLYEWLFPSAASESLRARWEGAGAVVPAMCGSAVYLGLRLMAMHHVVVVNNAPGAVLMTWPLLLWDYLRMMLWPVGLAVYYDAQILKQPTVEQFWPPLALLIICLVSLSVAFKRNKLAAFLGCWWMLLVLPSLIGIFSFPPNDILHDRYTYLSSVAFVLLLAWGFSRLVAIGGATLRLPVAALFGALVLVWGILAVRQTQVWATGMALYQNGVKVSPNNVRVRNLLAIQLFEAGQVNQAFALWDATLKLDPDAFDTNYAVGVTLFTVGRMPQGEYFLRRACALDRKKPESFLQLADLLSAENRREDALEVLRDGLTTVDAAPELLQEKMAEIQRGR